MRIRLALLFAMNIGRHVASKPVRSPSLSWVVSMQDIHGKLIPSIVALHPDRTGPAAIALFAVGMFACTASWAARPLVTEDAGVTAKSACEVESFAGRQLHPNITLASAQIACGLGWETQLSLSASRGKQAAASARAT